jgi:hypothetical protein
MSKPKSVKPPPPPPPQAIPEVGPETKEFEMRRQRRKSGYARTVITGNLAPETGKKTVLG